jgi:hypothetical protein
MRLTFIGKDPTRTRRDRRRCTATDGGSWIVPGWVVTESEYQHWSYGIAGPMVEAGEDIVDPAP